MIKLLFKTFALAVVISPVIALLTILLKLSDAQRDIIALGSAVYLYFAYYLPRAKALAAADRRRQENEYMDRFEAERKSRREKS